MTPRAAAPGSSRSRASPRTRRGCAARRLLAELRACWCACSRAWLRGRAARAQSGARASSPSRGSARPRLDATSGFGAGRGALAGGLDAGSERGHQVHHLRRLRRLGLDELLALELGLDQLHQRVAVLVAVVLGGEWRLEHLDQRERHLELVLGDLGPLERLDGGRADLVGVVERFEEHAPLGARPQRAEPLLVADRDLRDCRQALRLQRLDQQRERFRARLVRFQVVGALVEDGVDLLELHERLDRDRLPRRQGQLVEVVVVEDDVAVLGVLVAAHDLVVGHLAVEVGIPAQLLHARVVLAVKLAEGDILALGGGEEAHGNGDHSETDRASPDRSRHWGAPLVSVAALWGAPPGHLP